MTEHEFLEEITKRDAKIQELESEIKYLAYFHSAADFGPADGEVREIIQSNYEESSGEKVPDGWRIIE